MVRQQLVILIVASIVLMGTLRFVHSCNEMVCASVVSKCMLTQSCKCDLKNCSCCKECFKCLNYLYNECCSCVEMCPKPNETQNFLSRNSHVDELEDIPGLFSLVIDQQKEKLTNQWAIFSFPIDFEKGLYGAKFDKDIKISMQMLTDSMDVKKLDSKRTSLDNFITLNCTVAYLPECMSWKKCKESCQKIGSTSYRWFHDGCCECVGSACINYGINESRCNYCPISKEDVDEDELDFGEEMEPIEKNLDTYY